MSDRNLEVNRPSTSSSPSKNAQQTFRVKNSQLNVIKEKRDTQPGPSVRTLPNKVNHKLSHNDTTVCTNTLNELVTQCQNVKISTSSDSSIPVVNAKKTKRKNAKRKEKIRQNAQDAPNSTNQRRVLLPDPINIKFQQQPFTFNFPPPQEFNEMGPNQVNPAQVNMRYLENLAHHPNFQHIQKSQQSYAMLRSNQQRNTQYLHNLMQHPLFRDANTPSMNQNPALNKFQLHKSKASTSNNKTSQNDDKKGKSNEEKSFEKYLSEEEIEKGLKENIMLEGTLRINPKIYHRAYVSYKNSSEQDVFIDGIPQRNRALEGDIVVVQILQCKEPIDDKQQKQGKVVFIREKVHTRTCIGTLKLMKDKNKQKALFVPRDDRIPRLNIPSTSWPNDFYKNAQMYENTLFVAKIIDWYDVRFAIGIIQSMVGESGDLVAETSAILAQNDLDVRPFPPDVHNLYPGLDFIIPPEEMEYREDCRTLCLFSIDPFNCRDIDDAVSCRELENGNYEIGVHISDVSYFVKEDNILDQIVASKATTIYLVEKAYHMLPDELCLLCSLFPGVDKLAFSVFWEITKDAKVLSSRFTRTVINSCAKLAYEHAQAILDDSDVYKDNFPDIYNGFKYEDIAKVIKTLGDITNILRKKRFSNGALRIDQPKVSFSLNPSGYPESFTIYQSQPSHQLIEELMLLANITVAERISEDYPDIAFLRCHPPPNNYMLKELAASLNPMGIELDISSAGSIYSSLLQYMNQEHDVGRSMVLSMLCSKPMARAKYFCAGLISDSETFEHYALNVAMYTHFTSPIRRYADIMVHRLLSASLNYREKPVWEKEFVKSIAVNCNKQKYNAKRAGEMSTEFYTLKYIQMNSPVTTEAAIIDIREKYIDVLVACMGLVRRIFFNKDFPGKLKCIKNAASFRMSKMEILWAKDGDKPEVKQTLEIFSIIKIQMHKGEDILKVETKLLRPTAVTI